MDLFWRFLPFAFLTALGNGQGMGNGISKHTWAASDPISCSNWFTTYLPTEEEFHPGCEDNNHCPCATQGRVHTQKHTQDKQPPPPRDMGFGLHAINCTYHPYGELSIADMELKFQEKFGDFSHYDAFMDYNMGLWANNLDPFVQKFQEDEIPFMALKWMSEGKEYYSILANACGYILIELMSDTISVLDTETMMEDPHQRMTFSQWNSDLEPDNYITPIRVSRAISTAGMVDRFYLDILGSEQVYQETYEDGVTVQEIKPPNSKVHIQFWSGRQTSEDFTVADYENYVNSVHEDVMVSGVCGFDQWIDNHIAIDHHSSPTLDEVAEIFEAEGYYYHWWKIEIGGPPSQPPPGDMYQIYAADETGWGVQLDFPFHNPPADCPTYAATCQSEDGCLGQGNCKAEFYQIIENL